MRAPALALALAALLYAERTVTFRVEGMT